MSVQHARSTRRVLQGGRVAASGVTRMPIPLLPTACSQSDQTGAEHGCDADNPSYHLLLNADAVQKSSRGSFVLSLWVLLRSCQAGKHWHLTSACMSQMHDLAAMQAVLNHRLSQRGVQISDLLGGRQGCPRGHHAGTHYGAEWGCALLRIAQSHRLLHEDQRVLIASALPQLPDAIQWMQHAAEKQHLLSFALHLGGSL